MKPTEYGFCSMSIHDSSESWLCVVGGVGKTGKYAYLYLGLSICNMTDILYVCGDVFWRILCSDV